MTTYRDNLNHYFNSGDTKSFWLNTKQRWTKANLGLLVS